MKRILFILSLTIVSIGLKAQTKEMAKYKAMFTLNFIRYIGWPDDTKQGDFIIGVLKNSIMAQQLKEQTIGKKFGYQTIVIKEFKNVEEISNCQILYVDENINFSKNAEVIFEKLNNRSSLIITEDYNAIAKGSMINFVIVENKLKFEVSAANAEKFGLKLSSALLSMNNAIKI